MEAKTLALILFLITYVCLLIFTKVRAFIAIGSSIIFVILGFVGLLPTYDYFLLKILLSILLLEFIHWFD